MAKCFSSIYMSHPVCMSLSRNAAQALGDPGLYCSFLNLIEQIRDRFHIETGQSVHVMTLSQLRKMLFQSEWFVKIEVEMNLRWNALHEATIQERELH